MKRLLIIAALLFSSIVADYFDEEIKTLSRFYQFRHALQEGVKQGDAYRAFLLGLLHMQAHRLRDGYVPQDRIAAINNFINALHGGYPLASLYLSFLLPPKESVRYLEYAITHYGVTGSVINRYLQLVLENLYDDQKQLQKSYQILSREIDEDIPPQTRFLYAHLLFALGKKSQADRELNTACNAKEAPDSLRKLCMINPLAEIRDENGRLVSPGNRCNGK